MKTNAPVLCLVIFFASLTMVVSCRDLAPTSNPRPNTAPIVSSNPVRKGFSAWPGWIPWQVAQEQKLFEANQVAVDLKWFDHYLESINDLNAEKLDANSQTLNDTISSVAVGADLVVVLTNDNSTGNDKVIVGDYINSIADLKGKKIAVEEATVDHFLLLAGLQKAGLTQKDIRLYPMETSKAAAAFADGKFDAVAVFAPFTTTALKRPGSKELFSSKDFPGAISDHLVFNRRFVNEHPKEVQAIVDTWFDTLDYIKTYPDQALSIMARRAGVSVDEYKEYNAGTRIFSVEDNLTAFQRGRNMSSLPYAAQEISKFLAETGLALKKPNLNRLFDDRFVKAYAAKAKKDSQ